MKTLFASVFLLAVLSASALDIEKRFTVPVVSHRPDIKPSEKDRVRALLNYMENDLAFLEGGRAPHLEQVQRFGGSETQTLRFIEMLKSTGLWEVQVRYRDFGEQESAFLLIDHSPPVRMIVEVNSGREDFSRERFAEIAGAEQPAAVQELKPEGKGETGRPSAE